MPLRLLSVTLAVCAVFTPVVMAEGTDCTVPVLIIPDGRITQSSFPAGATYWYGIYAVAGHSYSVEFEPPANNFFNNFWPQFSLISVYGPNDLPGCRGTSTVVVTQNSGYAPAIRAVVNGYAYGAGRRVSFTAQSAGLYWITVTNTSGLGTYTFRAVDTTLINVRWNTMSGNDVQWIIMNISDMPVTGTMTIIDMNGQLIVSVPISLPIGGRVSRTSGSSDLQLARGIAGSVLFSHNGPPGSVRAEAFMLLPNMTLPDKFDAVTPQ